MTPIYTEVQFFTMFWFGALGWGFAVIFFIRWVRKAPRPSFPREMDFYRMRRDYEELEKKYEDQEIQLEAYRTVHYEIADVREARKSHYE